MEFIKLKVCPKCDFDASNEYIDSAKYCSECDTELVDKLSFQSQNGCPVSSISDPATISTVSVIPDISERGILKRSKKTALILAILLGPFTWLYSYKKDSWKAAVGLGLTVSSAIGASIFCLLIKNALQIDYEDFPQVFIFIPLILMFVFIWLPIWIWAIIDVAKKKEWVLSGIETRNKNTAVLLAVFLSPWAWFYTYKKDAWKFWLSFIILNGVILAFWIFLSSRLRILDESMMNHVSTPFVTSISIVILAINIINFAIILSTIIIIAIRPAQWYENFGKIETP
jgi:hypothetical protein